MERTVYTLVGLRLPRIAFDRLLRIYKKPEKNEVSRFFRGIAELGVVTVLGAAFHEVNSVARGRLKLVMRGRPGGWRP